VGQQISVVVTSLVIHGGSCATLTLLDPGGAIRDTTGLQCGFTSIGFGPDVLTIPGTYTVRLQLDPTATGSAKLWVSAPITLKPVGVNKPAAPMPVTRVGQGVRRTFAGKAGQRVSVTVTSLVVNGGSCATLTLLDPSGGTRDTTGLQCGLTSIGFGPDVLTVPGTYTVWLQLDPTATGGGKLWVSAPITLGTVKVNGPAAPMPVTRVGQGVRRTFAGKAGQRVSVAVTNLVVNGGSCATLTLLDPSGGTRDTTGLQCGLTSIGFGPDRLSVSGTYVVWLQLDPTATGGGSLTVST
jgi:hypothetical protein